MAAVGMLLIILSLLVLVLGVLSWPVAIIGPVAFCAFLVAGAVLVGADRIVERVRALEDLVRGDDRDA